MSLTGRKPSEFYLELLFLASTLNATLQSLKCAEDAALPLQVSTAGVNFTGFARRNGLNLVDESQIAGAVAVLRGATSVSATATHTLGPLSATVTIAPVSVLAGGGVFTAKVVLPTAGAIPGGRVEIPVALPAAAGRTVEFRNDTSSGVVLESFVSLGAATRASFTAYFDGAAWQPLHSTFRIP